MYKNRKIIAILFCLVLFLTVTVLTGISAEKKVYINGIDADYPPHAYVDESGKPAGFDVEALEEFVFTSIVDNLESADLETAFEVIQSDFDEETLNEWIKDIKKKDE